MTAVMVFQLGFVAGLLALSLLVPLVIIYLRRPKALTQAIPSLMFFSEHKGRFRSSMLFRKFIRNLLFIVQFLAIGLLAFSCTEPTFTTERFGFLDDTVLVLDTSASMTPVFDAMKREARSSIATETSIITAGAPARTVLKGSTPDRVYAAINELQPSDRRADLNGAILQAISVADEDPSSSRIVVITDRRSELSSSLIDLAYQKGHGVSIIDVSEPVDDNVGITDARISASTADLTIRNFASEPKNITVSGADLAYSIELAPRSLRRVSFPIGEGEYEFSISPKDAFAFDDVAYVSNSARSTLSVLIVTTSEETLPVERALRAINTTNIVISKNRLGTITQDHDLIIMSEYATQIILPSFYTDARRLAEAGSILVIGKDPRAGSIPESVLPVIIEGQLPGTQTAVSLGSELAEAVEFSDAGGPLDARARNTSITIATAGSADLITLMPIGSGGSIYYGYDDLEDSFPNTPYYPIFWSNLVEGLTGADSVSRFNVETGTIRTFDDRVRIERPDGTTVVEDHIDFDRTGFYRVGSFALAANVLDAGESDPAYVLDAERIESGGSGLVEVEIDLVFFIAIIALLLIILEFFMIKRRGEL